ILLVLLFNWWQDQRVRKQMHDQFSMGDEHETDVLLKDRKPLTPAQKIPADRQDPVFARDAEPVSAAAAAPASEPEAEDQHDEERVDDMTEGVIDLHFA